MKIEDRTVHGYGFYKNCITTAIPISRFFFTFQGNNVYQSSVASFENLPLINLASKEAPL